MKKILVTSDSHGFISKLDYVINRLKDDIEAVLHLGDLCEDIKELEKIYSDLDFYSVTGNCDFSNLYPSEDVLVFENKKIFMCHGHRYGVKYDYNSIVYKAREMEADICLFGHTHNPIIFEEENIYFMNPGSVALPRGFAYKTYGLIDLSNDQKPELSVVTIEKKGSRVVFYN